ncbi:MAG: Fumarate lyase, partial [Candidatus Kaiserbacteria bacterium]|nr:Fumarate lyase [Candidatus Kaiserbacteria bacterium]
MKLRGVFDSLSPIDYRYWDEEVAEHLSENGFTRYKLLVEVALVRVLHRRGICSEAALKEVEAACGQVSTAEVYEEEDRIRHDIRALANCIRAKVSDSTKPYVHMTATSFDIIDSANAARYKNVVHKVLIPSLEKLEGVLSVLASREAETTQVGRTHGQHAVPITFGFSIASYVSRLGGSIQELRARAENLVGKFSGAVGAYNASSLFFDDPERFEAEILAELGLTAAEHSTQVVPPEALTRLLCEVTIVAGILANLSDDMRHLQRTEIG